MIETADSTVFKPDVPVLRKTDWMAFGIVTLASLIFYVATLAPTVTLEYSGIDTVAADHLGVPHNTGFPVWTMLGWVFIRIFSFVTYLGNPNPAWALAFMSALCAALTCGLTSLIISSRAGRAFGSADRYLSIIVAVSTGLLLATSHTVWSQAVIVETHGLKILFQAVLLAIAYTWLQQPHRTRLIFAGPFLFGVGVVSHQPLILLTFPLLTCVFLKDKRLFREIMIILAVIFALFLLIEKNILPPVVHPLHITTFAYVAFNFLLLLAVYILLPAGRTAAKMVFLFELGMLVLLYLPLASDANAPVNWGYPRTWEGFLHVITRGQYERMIFLSVFSESYLFSLFWYLVELTRQFSLPVCIAGIAGMFSLFRLNRAWFWASLTAFLSFVLIAMDTLQNGGDLQETLILRTFIIQSYPLFALFIGAGLVLAVQLLMKLPVRIYTVYITTAALLLLPVIPLRSNYNGREMVRKFGGAEQNGHNFGWQFGNYMLRGSEAINEELDSEEEPLPNPEYPPAMAKNAIAFGGTDPGRFVLTYMVHSAHVRPDVFVLTQNALADNTYMSSTRDYYGDKIWIPSPADNAKAFESYVNEIRAGMRPQSAELKTEGGRVQISGALGIMEINGIISKMILEKNNYKHDCYVEESYVIPWMFPHLSPHGLIMKLNKEKIMLTGEMVRDDGDFWDWYTRKLLSDNRFRRDPVARKSFSKLRSALSGLYSAIGRLDLAENGFQQARMLYPDSPEANFRLVQEVLVRHGRYTEAITLMQDFAARDPRNERITNFVKLLENMEEKSRRISVLENTLKGGTNDVALVFELAESYLETQNGNGFFNTINAILSTSNMPPQNYFKLAMLCEKGKRYTEMVRALDMSRSGGDGVFSNTPPDVYLYYARMYVTAEEYEKTAWALGEFVKKAPNDWRAWMDLALIHMTTGETNSAVTDIEQAMTLGGDPARKAINQDQRFAPIRSRIGGK